MTEQLYRGYNKDELENLYNQKHRIPDYDNYPTNWKRDSDRARKELEVKFDVRYGDHSLETYDVFLGSPGYPIHVFSMVDIGIPRINQTLNLWRRLL